MVTIRILDKQMIGILLGRNLHVLHHHLVIDAFHQGGDLLQQVRHDGILAVFHGFFLFRRSLFLSGGLFLDGSLLRGGLFHGSFLFHRSLRLSHNFLFHRGLLRGLGAGGKAHGHGADQQECNQFFHWFLHRYLFFTVSPCTHSDDGIQVLFPKIQRKFFHPFYTNS